MSDVKILVIDDEKLLRWSLEQNLSKEGYEVVSAEKGLDGLAMYKDEAPDIILLDIQLPDVSGITVLEGINEKQCPQISLLNMDTSDFRAKILYPIFGIKGKQWDRLEFYQQLYNEHWCKVSKIETPKNIQAVENGTYW